MNNYELGKPAYETYARSVGGKSFNGQDLLPWKDLSPTIQKAWEDCAKACYKEVFDVVLDLAKVAYNKRTGGELLDGQPLGTQITWYGATFYELMKQQETDS